MTENTGKDSAIKLQSFRKKLKQHKLEAYLVPRADEWQGEYVPACAERLAWLTGFTGSAGLAVIGTQKAAVFSDSRYTEQGKSEIDGTLFERDCDREKRKEKISATDWLLKNLKQGGRVGYDPKLHTVREIETLSKKLAAKKIRLVPIAQNLVDAVWDDRPEPPKATAIAYAEKYAGRSNADKRKDIAKTVKNAGGEAVLLTAPDSIAWLLNVRGRDVPHVPVVLSYALLHKNGSVDWFVPEDKITAKVSAHIGNKVKVHNLEAMPAVLIKKAKQIAGKKGTILLDERTAPIWFRDLFKSAKVKLAHIDDPVIAPRALKNETEKQYIRQAHIKDGVALTKFWKWIDETAPKGGLTEASAVARLHAFRKEQRGFQDDSFDAIVGWAANGAIVHYRPDEKNSAIITKNSLLLVDSGGQYLGGTTDNTRTRVIGRPTKKMREHFTRVLKGHIAIASARFYDDTTGRDIDVLARQFLHKAGIDYGHGTGHGVGSYLSVHEPGTGIYGSMSKPLRPGMLISNEPGYYKPGQYGIRIENLVMVEETGDEKLKYQFNTVSLTPIDRKLIDMDLLDSDEIKWLNDYHKRIYTELSPHLNRAEKAWLKKETAPLRRVFD